MARLLKSFRSLSGRLEVLTVTRRAMFHNLLVSAPSRGDTGGSNELSVRFKMDVRGVFPSPPEVTGGSYADKQNEIVKWLLGFRPLSR